VVDTGASFPIVSASASDYIPVVASISKLASTPIAPYALITGEDTPLVDLPSTDSDLDFASTFSLGILGSNSIAIREFGTATLVFYYSGLNLVHILVEPDLDRFDWLHWIPFPRLVLPESYFHCFGLNYSQGFAFVGRVKISWSQCASG